MSLCIPRVKREAVTWCRPVVGLHFVLLGDGGEDGVMVVKDGEKL